MHKILRNILGRLGHEVHAALNPRTFLAGLPNYGLRKSACLVPICKLCTWASEYMRAEYHTRLRHLLDVD